MLANDASFINNTAGGPASQDNAGRGGAAMLSIAASLTAVNCLWEGNQARKDGGAMAAEVQATAVRIVNCTFRGNTAGPTEVGGAILVDRVTQLEATNSTFVSNRAGEIAGAIAATAISNATLLNVDMYNNTSGSQGGALGVWNSARMVVQNSRIWGNTAHCWGGGAAVVFETGTLNISSSDVWNNTGRQQGGAVSAKDQAQVYITACNLSGNAASRRGGAVRIADGATVVLRDSIISGNQVGRLERCPKDSSPPSSSSTSCGGAVFIGDTPSGRSELASKVELINTTVAGNSAGRGGGLCAEPSAATSSSMPGQTTVRALAGDNTTFIDNSGSPGSDVYALAAAMLSMSPVGSNLNISSSSVFWNISCGMGSYLDPTRGTCTKCAAPSYILEEGEMRSTTQCQRCPEAAECFGGAVLVAKPKFYHTHGVNEAGGTVPTCRLDILTR
uniref:Right handed beta helix domain-containing protein n=1 Tax=Tetradesmus obliquus TaxID=3088 RepID=A0A383WN70_TETOB|eukprot:jgi/Sobl393_1/1674/SZX78634.1